MLSPHYYLTSEPMTVRVLQSLQQTLESNPDRVGGESTSYLSATAAYIHPNVIYKRKQRDEKEYSFYSRKKTLYFVQRGLCRNGTLPTVYEEKRFDGILLQDVFKTWEIHQKKILACLNVKYICKFYDSSQTIKTQMK